MNKKEPMYFVYPAYFVDGEDEIVVSFPDLELVIEGDTYEEAFLFAKNYLKEYCIYSLKHDFEIPDPSYYKDIIKNGDRAMLVDTFVFPNGKDNKIDSIYVDVDTTEYAGEEE